MEKRARSLCAPSSRAHQMISNGTQLQVTDNSGAKVAQCINQSGKSWGIGDVITVSIKKAQPRSKVAAGQVRRRGRLRFSLRHVRASVTHA